MAEASKYTWIVSHGAIGAESSASVGQIGPRGGKTLARFDVVVEEGRPFRLLDEAGEPRYTGWICGEYLGNEPLEEYGRDKGCVAIELERDGEWVGVGAD